MSLNKFVSTGSLLTIDLFIVSLVNWIYWLVISKFAAPSEVGLSISLYNFATLTSVITLMGLEYTLVKKASSHRSDILGTAIIIELCMTAISAPILIYSLNLLYHGSLHELSWIAVGIVIFSSLRYVLRYTLLGISDAKNVLIINSIGAGIQLAFAYIVVSKGFGASGILGSFLLNVVFVSVISFIIARRSFELNLGNLRYAKEILIDALINMPTPLAKTFIYTLSIVLLASFGISQYQIGIFYITLMLTVIAGGFAGNIGFMVIPASSIDSRDLSADSVRIGLSLTAPLIVALIVAPKFILSIIRPEYISADFILVVLSAGILPYIIAINAISKFNNLGKSMQIISIGLIQLIAFVISFFILVPLYGTVGAAFSILISSIASATISIIWSKRELIKYMLKSLVSIAGGIIAGYFMQWIFVSVQPPIIILISIVVSLVLILSLKNTSVGEISLIVKAVVGRN